MLPILALSAWTLYGGGAGLDLVSTEVALARGGIERNPLGQTRAARIALKVAGTSALVWADRKLGPRKWVLRIVYAGGMGYVVMHNMRVRATK